MAGLISSVSFAGSRTTWRESQLIVGSHLTDVMVLKPNHRRVHSGTMTYALDASGHQMVPVYSSSWSEIRKIGDELDYVGYIDVKDHSGEMVRYYPVYIEANGSQIVLEKE